MPVAVQLEVDQRGGGVFDRGKALVESAGGEQPAQQRLGNRLAGLVMAGVFAQILRRRHPVLEDLRRELDEIAAHRGAGLRGIAHPAQQRVQPVTEFVKQGLGVVEAQQGRLALLGSKLLLLTTIGATAPSRFC